MRQMYNLPVDRALHPFLVVQMPQSSILWLLSRDQEDRGDQEDLVGLAIPTKTTRRIILHLSLQSDNNKDDVLYDTVC